MYRFECVLQFKQWCISLDKGVTPPDMITYLTENEERKLNWSCWDGDDSVSVVPSQNPGTSGFCAAAEPDADVACKEEPADVVEDIFVGNLRSLLPDSAPSSIMEVGDRNFQEMPIPVTTSAMGMLAYPNSDVSEMGYFLLPHLFSKQ